MQEGGARARIAVSSAVRCTACNRAQAVRGVLSHHLVIRDSGTNLEANETISSLVRAKIREMVKNPDVAESLLPDHIYACKRPCLDTNYFETYNRLYAEHFAEDPPCRTTVEITSLPTPIAIELKVIAALHD